MRIHASSILDVYPCASGLHASVHPFDALKYAPGNMLHLVIVDGEIQWNDKDKIVGRRRKILASINAEKLMRDFARWNALKVLHFWPNPPEVVVKFLKTGDESLRAAAWDAAWAAARAAAWDAASAAAWAAAWDAFIAKSRSQFKRMVKAEFKKQNPKLKLP